MVGTPVIDEGRHRVVEEGLGLGASPQVEEALAEVQAGACE
jgi:hypothetical protein